MESYTGELHCNRGI